VFIAAAGIGNYDPQYLSSANQGLILQTMAQAERYII